MKARIAIEYDIPKWDEAALGLQALREREEQRWITSPTVCWDCRLARSRSN
jgi:hypothetical protein